jgi:hypothetical protein
MPRQWNTTPVTGSTMPLPKFSKSDEMSETALRSPSTTAT